MPVTPLGVTWRGWGRGLNRRSTGACQRARREGREEEKETDGQQWKHKLTRRKRINSRQRADPSTYAAPQPARRGEVPRHPQSPSLQRGSSSRRRSVAGEERRLKARGKKPSGV